MWQWPLVQSHSVVRTHGRSSELSQWACQMLCMLSNWLCQLLLSTGRIHTYSQPDPVWRFLHYGRCLVRPPHQLSESTHIVAVILAEISDAIDLVLSESTVSCQRLHEKSPCSWQRLFILSPWSCESAPLAVWVFIYIDIMIFIDATHAIALTLLGLMVDYQSISMYITDIHFNHDFWTIYMWNEIWFVLHPLYSNNRLPNQIHTI